MDYKQLQSLLNEIDSNLDVAECHGTLCGLICADKDANEYMWLLSILDDQNAVDELDSKAKSLLLNFYHETVEMLNDLDMLFSPLLPDEDVLPDRILALGEWCAGFVYGLNMGGIKDFNKLPGDASEIAQDILDIARVGYNNDEDGDKESSEFDFHELKEYVRVGVIVIHEELHPPAAVDRTLH